MFYGLIGEKLGHSFSREIHAKIASYPYQLIELAPQELDRFMKKRKFTAINVTIPYKQAVMPYLDEIDENARRIGAVNTIVKRVGRLYGYNTDYSGASALLRHAGIELQGRHVMILGTGGTSHTLRCVASDLGADRITLVSRHPSDGEIGYDELPAYSGSVQVLINTTPVGMYPHTDGRPVNLDDFPALEGVADVIYNPLRTPLIRQAQARGLKAEGGLYMLAAQAVYASALFRNIEIAEEVVEKTFLAVLREKENIVLIGMPSSGKSTVGKELAEKIGRELLDTDREIVRQCGKTISRIFAEDGEAFFREREREVSARLSDRQGIVIATGGGIILNEQNLDALRANGRIYFLDRPLEQLMASDDRPLASDRAALEKRYAERYDLYRAAADKIIDASGSVRSNTWQILEDYFQ